jgi:hypothetical protein
MNSHTIYSHNISVQAQCKQVLFNNETLYTNSGIKIKNLYVGGVVEKYFVRDGVYPRIFETTGQK